MRQVTGLLSSQAALPLWKTGALDWKPTSPESDVDALRQKILEADPAAFQHALTREAAQRARSFLDGIRAYREHPYRRDVPPMPVVWQSGSTKLIDYGDPCRLGPPVLVVPSLVNRGYVLDLMQRRSLLRWLGARGFRPFLVDWDQPGPAEAAFGLDDYIGERLSAILDHVQRCAGRPVLLGYCMGGLLGMGLAALHPQDLSGLILLATPWDFHAPQRILKGNLDALQDVIEPAIAACGHLPPDLLQLMFLLQDPKTIERKFQYFARLKPKSAAARRFVALEDWANDGVPLTASVARQTLQGWYGENQTGRGTWRVAGIPVRPERLGLPVLTMIPSRDRIVTLEQALALGRRFPRGEIQLVEGGHVGMLVGDRAVTEIYTVIGKTIGKMARR